MYKKVKAILDTSYLNGSGFIFKDYIDTLMLSILTHSLAPRPFEFYSHVFNRLLSFKIGFVNSHDLFVLHRQLLFGCRFSEVYSMVVEPFKTILQVHIHSSKGSLERYLKFKPLNTYLKILIPLFYLC